MTGQLIAGVLVLFGSQQICLGHGVVGLGCCVWGLAKGRRWLPVVLAFWLALGVCSGLRERALAQHPPVPHGDIRVQPASWHVTDGFARFDGIADNGVRVSGSLAVTARKAKQIVRLAVPVTVKWAKCRRIARATNLGEFDFRTYSWQQKHQAYTVVTGNLVVTPHSPHGILDWLNQVRFRLMQRINTLPKTTAFYARALLLGVMDPDAATTRADFSRLGVIHLFSVSGLHVFALVGACYWFGRQLRITVETIDRIMLLVLPLVLLIIPMSAGLLRAIWMRLLAIGAGKLGLMLSPLDLLLVVLTGNLLYYPQVLAGLGGQMTYLLTLVLVLLPEVGAFRQCFRMAIVSTGPVLAHVYGLHLLTFLFNYLLMPLFEGLLMPVLAGLVCWPHAPGISFVEWCLQHLNFCLAYLARLPGYIALGQLPLVLLWLLTVASLWWLAGHSRAPFIFALCSVILVYIWQPSPRVTFFALGQGEAVLFEPPWHAAPILVGAGGSQLREDTTQATRVITAYLQYRGITQLAALVLPDATSTSAGDAGAVIQSVPTRLVLYPAAADQTKRIRSLNTMGMTPVSRDLVLSAGAITIQIVPLRPEKPADLRVYAKIGQQAWWLSGRHPKRDQARLMQRHIQPTYIRLGARGGNGSVTMRGLQQMMVQAVIASPDLKGRQSGISTLTQVACAKAGVPILRTDRSGMIWWQNNRFYARVMTQ